MSDPRRFSRRLYFIVVLAATACRSNETSLERGDRFWADSSYAMALAEYRLAAREFVGDPKVQARVAHAYALTGSLEQAREEFNQLLKLAPEYADQAVFDYLAVARAAAAHRDRFGLARAVEAALELRPGIDVGTWSSDLAAYYAGSGDAERALEYFERALAYVPESEKPRLLFEIASVHERQGDCAEATSYFRSYLLRMAYGDSANDARFHIGSCAFELGRRARDQGSHEAALEHFTTVIDYGSPPNLQDQAWLERGEALVALGRPADAVAAFRRVLELTEGRTTQTSTRARRRIIELVGAVSPGGIGMSPGTGDI